MSDIDWDGLEELAKETGKPIRIGSFSDFTRREKSAMSKEARERNLNISMGNSKRDSSESNDDLFVMAKGTQ